MVYYIRFLKPPRFEQDKKSNPKQARASKKSVYITTLICITTDLGDDFLAEDVELSAIWTDESSGEAIHEQSLKWEAGSRQIAVSMGPFSTEHAEQHPAVLEVRPKSTTQDRLEADIAPLVVSGYSAPFGQGLGPAEKLILRKLNLASPSHAFTLRIWEETGNSIARHIWDAALASVIFLNKTISNPTAQAKLPALSKLLHKSRDAALQAVELGAGCGIVGIALASMLDSCEVLLTDLPEVEEIVQQNIGEAHLKKSSSVTYQNLDWDDPPPQLCRKPIDLILVSDCTYNADSLPSLVSVLDKLTRDSPEALVLVALKRRHESEAVFFELMQSAQFSSQHTIIHVPAQHDQQDEIELHCYQKAACQGG